MRRNPCLLLIAVATLCSLLTISDAALAEPSIDIEPPTPGQGVTIGNGSVYLNASASSTGNVSVFFDLDDSLVLWMRMDDVNQTGPGALVYDNSSYGNNGTAYGDSNQTPAGYFGKGYDFDGTGDFINVPDSPSLEIVDAITLSAWVRKDQFINHGKVVVKRFDDPNNDPWELYSLDFKGSSPGYPCFLISDGTVGSQRATCGSSYPIPLDEWYHIAGTYNGSLMSVYVNGAVVNTSATSIKIGTNDMSVTIGGRNYTDFGTDGSIDDVMIFNRSLSPAEVAGLYADTSSRYLENELINLSDGTHTFRAYAQDTAGNANETQLRNFTVEYSTADVTICRDLWQTGTTYVLQNDLSTSGTCIVVKADNVTLDMNGYNITGDDGETDRGVYCIGYDDATIRNGFIYDFGYGIFLSGNQDNTVSGISAVSNTYGIYMDGGSDNNITDSNISGSSTYDVSMSEGSKNAIFLNVTYDESLENVGAGSELIRRWRYGLQVTYPSGNHYVPNAQVAAYNSTGDLVENLTTNGTGWTVSSSLIDYVRMGGTKDYYSNYTINASHPDHLSASKSYNVTAEGENLNDSIPLGGLFSLKESSPETDNTHHVAIADLNNDGYLDYIAGNTGQNRIYLNDGTGHFTLSESSPESDDTPTLAIADLDNDGDQDYIAGNYQQLNRIYLNNGTGNFTLHENNTETGIERTQSLAIADLDNDGDLDYIAANSNAPVQIYKNNGSASFTIYQNISGQYYAAALGDFNGDGYTDLVIGGVQSYMTRVYFNNGSGYFVLDDTFPDNTLYTYDVTVGDIDNDGHLDIIEGNGNTLGNQQDRVFLNDGSGKFNLRQSLGDKNTWSIAIADLNNDGYLDFIEGNYQQGNEIYMNNGSGYFNSYEESQTGDGFSVAAADLDLDGDLDYISSYSSNQANRIYLNGKNDNRYVKLYIRGLGSYVGRDGVGTKVSAYLGSSLLGYREVTAADDSQDGTNQLHFGLASTGTYTINATFITGKVVSCTVQPAESFTVYENGSATGGVSCYVVDFPPGISFMQPFDGNITTDIDINFSCDVYDDNQLASITIYIWNASDDIFYSDTRPISGIQNQSSWLVQAMVPDTYKWNCRVLDNASKFNQRPSNYSFRVVVENNLYLKLVINNTDNIVYIPGEGEFNSSSLADQIYSNPPHYYLASYLGNVVSGLVFSMQIPGAVRVGRNASGNTHYIALDQDLERSSVFLVFTLGDWKVIENRIALIEAGRFLTNILPSFSYGLGNKYSLDLALGYADIDLRGRLRLLKGSHKIVIENNGTSAGKPVVVISRE